MDHYTHYTALDRTVAAVTARLVCSTHGHDDDDDTWCDGCNVASQAREAVRAYAQRLFLALRGVLPVQDVEAPFEAGFGFNGATTPAGVLDRLALW